MTEQRVSTQSVEHLLRDLTPRVLGALARRHRDFAAAEDAVQEALVDAYQQWPSEGMPNNPGGWLYKAALRRFKRQCNYGGVFRLAKANTWHEKRSDKRRRERRERMRTILKAARRTRQRIARILTVMTERERAAAAAARETA